MLYVFLFIIHYFRTHVNVNRGQGAIKVDGKALLWYNRRELLWNSGFSTEGDMKIYRDIHYTDTESPAQMLDIYLPDAASFPVLIYFHGGGLEAGDRSGNIFYKALAQKGIAVVTANYRMYPDAAFPDYLLDAAAAVSWAYSHMSEYGQVTGYFIGGSSAGGYISQMLCFDKKYLAAHGIDSDKVDGYIHDAGQPTTHFNILRERGMDTRRIVVDEAAPLYHITGDRTFAPMQIIVSSASADNVGFSNAAIVVHNMALAAAELGVGACYIWGAVMAINQNPKLVQKLGLPEGFTPCCSIILGKTDEKYTLREIPADRIQTKFID